MNIRILEWINAIDPILGALNTAEADAPPTPIENELEALAEQLLQADKINLRDWLEHSIAAVEQHSVGVDTALSSAFEKNPNGVMFGQFYWLLYLRWVAINRMYCPERLEELKIILSEARSGL